MLAAPLTLALLAAISADTPIEALPCWPAVRGLPAEATTSTGALELSGTRWRACAYDAEDRDATHRRAIERRAADPVALPPPPPAPAGWSTLEVALLSAGVALVAAGLGAIVGYAAHGLAGP